MQPNKLVKNPNNKISFYENNSMYTTTQLMYIYITTVQLPGIEI